MKFGEIEIHGGPLWCRSVKMVKGVYEITDADGTEVIATASNKQNADAIASVPALLDALEMAEERIEELERFQGMPMSNTLSRIKALLQNL